MIAWIVVVALVVVGVGLLVWYAVYSYVDRFVQRCEDLLTTDRFMLPCEIAVAHANKHGITFVDIHADQEMIANAFPVLEQHGRVVGREHAPDEFCQCTRAFCLKYGGTRRRANITKRREIPIPGLRPSEA